jgi:hypothetical protein
MPVKMVIRNILKIPDSRWSLFPSDYKRGWNGA